MATVFEALARGNFRSTAERVQTVRELIDSGERAGLGQWLDELLPAEKLVPEVYGKWRPLVRDGLKFLICRLSAARLAPKIVEQLELAEGTPAEIRLLRLIARMPALQKLGQVLARNRHLAPPLRAALTLLENAITDVRAEEIGTVVRAHLGSRLDEHEVEIEPSILSEASVSALLGFTWRNPANARRESGVFKVLKPHIRDCFAEDLELFRQLADFLAASERNYGFDPGGARETLADVCDLLQHEVDFPREQETLEAAHRVWRGLAGARVPRLIRPLCGSDVTAMTRERGVKITEVFPDSPALRERVAAQLIEALICTPLFGTAEERMFHADPHAGNLLYDEERGEVVILDWALVERVSAEQVRQLVLLVMLLALRDTAGASAVLAELAGGSEAMIRDRVGEFLRALSLWHLPGSGDLMRLLDGLALDGVRFPAPLLMLRKALFTLDGILEDLAGSRVTMDAVIARWLAARWPTLGLRLPLAPFDWWTLNWSALWYAPRLWA